jgi:hypothetical protein
MLKISIIQAIVIFRFIIAAEYGRIQPKRVKFYDCLLIEHYMLYMMRYL